MTSLDPLFSVLKGAVSFVLVLSVLIAVHEFGHFWVARLFGMHVDAFVVMMGGLRKTKLDNLLKKPLLPRGNVWTFGILAFLALLAGVVLKSEATVYGGLFLVGLVLPVWVVSRLGALYHMKPGASFGMLGKVWALAVLLSLLASKGKGLEPMQLLGLISLASFVGTLIVYYNPVFHKPEDAPHGHGQIALDEKDVAGHEIEGSTYSAGQVKVPVMFRPLLSRKDKYGTEFALLCLPLGGFAAIKGMHPKEDGSETKIEGGFYSKSPFARFCVLFAGPLFSIVFGVLVLAVNYCVTGIPEAKKDPVIGVMAPETPAAKAGVQQGDRVLSVNSKPVTVFFDVVKEVRQSHEKVNGIETAKPVHLVVDRKGQQFEFDVTPMLDPTPSPVLDETMKPTDQTAIQAKLGIRPQYVNVPMPFGMAASEAVAKPIELVTGLAQTFSRPATIPENVGGPAAIAEQVTQASEQGFEYVVYIAGLLSISLGVMNLLPIVPFDGGQMMVAVAEMFRGGKRLSIQLQSMISTVGMFLIFILIIGVVTIDIGRHAPK